LVDTPIYMRIRVSFAAGERLFFITTFQAGTRVFRWILLS
jgi:hypothetical protein